MRYVRGDEFWDFTRDGTKITIVTGAIGTPGTTTVEELASPKLAETRERVLLNKQGREGWKLYKEPEPEPGTLAVVPPAPVVYDARNPEMERAILEDPENDQLYEVYGDWLQQQGDPRGKLIALDIATRGKTYGDKFHAARDRFENHHRNYLSGGFRSPVAVLHLGFIRRISLSEGKLAGQIGVVLATPAARFVTSIALHRTLDYEEREATEKDVAAALVTVAGRAPTTLRDLELGGDTVLRDLSALAPRFPTLRRFAILNDMDRSTFVGREAVAQLVTAPWSKLATLRLDLRDTTATFDDVAPLFARTDLPALVELDLRTGFDSRLALALAGSKLAAQLEDVAFQFPDEHDVAFPFELLAAFRNLKRLGLPLDRLVAGSVPALPVEVYDVDQARFDAGGE